MYTTKKLLLLFIAIFSISCQEKAQTNTVGNFQIRTDEEVNFDRLLKCSDYTYDGGYFVTADYGCIYSPTGENKYGNIIIYLVSKNQPDSDESPEPESARINNLSADEYKKDFKIYVFLIDKKYLSYTRTGDPLYYQKSAYEEKAYTFDDIQKKWKMIDSIKINNEGENLKEQTWRENLVENSIKKVSQQNSSIEKWEGLYLNSDDQKLTAATAIKNRIGWYQLIISPGKIIYENDPRLESEFPTEAPGGYVIKYYCDYQILGDTIKLYEKSETGNTEPHNISGNGRKIVLILTKRNGSYFGSSPDIDDSEKLRNSARIKSKKPYLFSRFVLNKNQ